MSPAKKKPTKVDLLTLLGLAHEVIGQLQPDALKIPALRQFYDLSNYLGVAPDDAPHIPDDGKI